MQDSERNTYGSSRLGQEQIDEVIASTNINLVNINTVTQNIIGDKYFEMSNHLGNLHDTWVLPNKTLSGISPDWNDNEMSGVKEVVTDRKLPEPDGQGGIDYFTADVVSWNDYYPFGMLMPGRNHQSPDYRYGFNGAEKDDEVKNVTGSHYDLGLRNYDPRVARMFSVDPRAGEYPWQTSYAYHRNSPIMNIDYLGGGDGIYVDEETGEVLGQDEHGASDGLIHYTSKVNWDKYGNSPYANRSELLMRGGISRTIDISESDDDGADDGDVFTILTKKHPELDNDAIRNFTERAGVADKAGKAFGVKHPGAKGVGAGLSLMEYLSIAEKATSGDIEGATTDLAISLFESRVIDRALMSPDRRVQAVAAGYYLMKAIFNLGRPDLSDLDLPEDWDLQRDQDNTRVGSGQGF